MSKYQKVIGIDMRTFSYTNSTTRGIGHYTLNHIQNIMKLKNNWKFILFSEENNDSSPYRSLLNQNNVESKLYLDYVPGEIDLFHIPDPMNTSLGFDSPLRMINNVPTTILFHDLIPLYFYYDSWPENVRSLYDLRLKQIEYSDAIILTNSLYTKNDLAKNTSIPEKRIKSVWAGINSADENEQISTISNHQILKKFKINEPYFLHVGALDSHKNFEAVLNSFLLFSKERRSLLIVVGKKNESFINLENILLKQNIKNVIFTDYVTREELTALYSNALALLFLSRYEGFGFPALEAMANNCPVITSTCASLPEVVGDAALKVDPDNFQLTAEYMKKIFDDHDFADYLREHGHQRAKIFTWEKTAVETLRIWKKLLNEKNDNADHKGYDREAIHSNNIDSKDDEQHAKQLKVVWQSPVFDTSGYADEARNFILGLTDKGVNVKTIPNEWSNSKVQISKVENNKLVKSSSNYFKNLSDKYFHISHNFPPNFQINKRAYLNIGRTMFETDSIPKDWVNSCNKMNEIWVPSEFNLQTFADAGVEKEKLVKIHESIDVEKFNSNVKPLNDLKSIKSFKFLSVFDWSLRKGWDVLLDGFIKEFKNNLKVVLILKIWSSAGRSFSDIEQEIKSYLKLKHSISEIPKNLIFYSKNLSDEDFPRLYKSVDAYVSPTRGEGWGRPMMEAMAMGLPTIATRCSGQLEFMNDNNSFLVDNKMIEVSPEAYKETPSFKGHRWAEPSLVHLRKLMKEVLTNKSLANSKGKIAKEYIKNNFSREIIADKVIDHLAGKLRSECANNIGKKENELILNHTIQNIILEGPYSEKSSIGIINSKIKELLTLEQSNMAFINPGERIDRLSEVHITHSFPPIFERPNTKRWIIIQPWEFGSLPEKWANEFKSNTDEVWVPTNYVRNVFITSGVPSEKVFVLPNGFDKNIFNKSALKFKLKTKKKFKFLFVGGTIYRKGIDILLKAYTELFTNDDDVCLVIKDMGGNSFYNGQNYKKEIERIQGNELNPEVEYIDSFLRPEELAGLYRSCDLLVHPYRGEGFGMPILEAMACSLPVMVTNGGACLDFCNSENSILVSADKVYYKHKRVGNDATVNHPWMYEVKLEELKHKMELAFKREIDLELLGQRALDYVHDNFTWEKVIQKMKSQLMSEKNISKKPAGERSRLAKYIELTMVDFENGKYEEALQNVQYALECFNDFTDLLNDNFSEVELLNLAGNIALVCENLEKAKEYFERQLEIETDSSTACFGLGEVFNKAEMFNESKTMFEWAIANDAENHNAKIRLKEVNSRLNLPENHNSLIEQNISQV